MRAIQLSSAIFLVLTVLNAGTNTVTATSCADRVSTGDQSLGISAVEDASCSSGGLGCFPYGDQCRFCRVSSSSEADHLKLCSDIKVSSTSASGSKPDEEAAVNCLSLVSVGDQGVGISAVAATNPTCAANGLGCFQSGQCRFCQSRATTQSAPYLKCSNVGGSSTGSTPTNSPTSTPAPSATASSTSTTCSSVVSRSGLEGISYVSESRCNVASPTLLGCSARTSCRLCRNYKNEANQYLVSCQVLKDQGATEATESAAVGSASSGTNATESPIGTTVNTAVNSTGSLTVSTKTVGASATSAASSATVPIAATAAVVALLVVVMMSVIYVKGRRDPLDEPTTPEDYPDGEMLTPHGGRGYTPREGSLVMVVSQTSIATL